jgi:hypothetical protein
MAPLFPLSSTPVMKASGLWSGHGALQGARRRQAVPARGLPQGSCWRRHVFNSTLHCIAHGGGRRCQHEGCTKSVARAPGSTLCTLCLRRTQPQPDGAEEQ